MEAILITYVRDSTQEKWHWEKACPEYPHTDRECMISTMPVPEKNLCLKCMKLDLGLAYRS